MIDDVDSVAVDPTGEAEIDVEPGWHSLTLLGVADQCTVAPKPEIEVEVLGGNRRPVAFAVSCPATRAHVTVRTTGLTPDRDGYLLTVDGVDSLNLDPIATTEVELAPGPHTLSLLDVSDRCSVAPGITIEVDILPGTTTPVVFEVSCSTGASITLRTAGLDIDPDGYRLEVDGSDRGPIRANGTALTALEPGTRTIALTGLTPNCAFDGPSSRTVTVAKAEMVPIEFAVVCTATSGVIGVTVQGSGSGLFQVAVDGTTRLTVPQGGGPRYVGGVPAGAHVVSVTAGRNCLGETESQTVTVRAGTLVRDTVEVTFSVSATCVSSGFRVTTHTTGRIPRWRDYILDICRDPYGGPCPSTGAWAHMAPNDTLLVQLDQGTYWAALYVPSKCLVTAQNPPDPIRFTGGGFVEVEFRVTCS
jgi:hypothetical protein